MTVPPSDFQFEGWVFKPELTVDHPRWGRLPGNYNLAVNISAKPRRGTLGVVPKVDSLLLRVDASKMRVLTPTGIDTVDFVMSIHMSTTMVPTVSRDAVLWLYLSDSTGQSVLANTSEGDSLKMLRHIQSYLGLHPGQ
jgi:hypothetical protein